MQTDHFQGFWIEYRGSNWYGFCDEACKEKFVRKQKWAIINAMEAHCREVHGGQLVLPLAPEAQEYMGTGFTF